MQATPTLTTPLDAIVFDCDGTLTTIEGIDELARMNACYDEIKAMTQNAMNHGGLNVDLYNKRLQIVKPTNKQVLKLAELYFQHQTKDAQTVIQLLQQLGKTIYILSAGMNPAVSLFGEQLGVKPEHICAIELVFDDDGNYLDFDRANPLTENQGKHSIVSKLLEKHPRILHIGDGMNDHVTANIVTRFVGYGGVFYRPQLADQCEYYIRSESLSPLLALSLTADEIKQLPKMGHELYQSGLAAMS